MVIPTKSQIGQGFAEMPQAHRSGGGFLSSGQEPDQVFWSCAPGAESKDHM